MGARITNHNSRKGYARHNDRDFDVAKSDHIDQERQNQNIYRARYEGLTFEETERKYYTETFGAWIEKKNQAAIMSRHPERVRTLENAVEDLLKSKRTCPEETITQLGNKNNQVPSEKLMQMYNRFMQWHARTYPQYICLDMALHRDETTPHVHRRGVWIYTDQDGTVQIGQAKALEQMGIERPNPDKPQSRNNNAKQTYSAACRDKFFEIAKEMGLDIETEPERRVPSEQNLQRGDYIIQAQDKQIVTKKAELDHLENMISYTNSLPEAKVAKIVKEYKDLVKVLQQETVDYSDGSSEPAIDYYRRIINSLDWQLENNYKVNYSNDQYIVRASQSLDDFMSR